MLHTYIHILLNLIFNLTTTHTQCDRTTCTPCATTPLTAHHAHHIQPIYILRSSCAFLTMASFECGDVGASVKYGASLVPCNTSDHSFRKPARGFCELNLTCETVLDLMTMQCDTHIGITGRARRAELHTHLQCPRAVRILAPRVRRHERPLGEAVARIVVVGPPTENHRCGVHGRRQEHLQVAATRTVGRNDGLHVLQIVDLGVGAIARVGLDLQYQRVIGRDFSVEAK